MLSSTQTQERKDETTIRPGKIIPTKSDPERQFGGPQSGLPPAFIIGSALAPYLIVGIEFGTYFCRVCTFIDGEPRRVQPHEFASCVEEVLRMPMEARTAVHALKDLLAEGGVIKCGNSTYSAGELTTMLLKGLKNGVEHSTERLLAKAVISVPACFPHAQRRALIQAANDAGVTTLGLINDPAAVALHACYANDNSNGRYLVLSLESYSCEVSLVHVQNKLIETKAVRGAGHLSAHRMWQTLIHGLKKEFKADATEDLNAAIAAMQSSFKSDTTMTVEIHGKPVSIPRHLALSWLRPFKDGIAAMIQDLLHETLVAPENLTGFILTGRAADSWLISEILNEQAAHKPKWIGNVSAGAAIYAALLVRQVGDWVVWDALADPVIVAQATRVREIISANSPVPINGHVALSPSEDGKTEAIILQKAMDDDAELVQVARVRVLETLQRVDETATVDLAVMATADGTLDFAARHKSLDINLTLEVLDAINEDPTIYELDSHLFGMGFAVEKIAGGWFVTDINGTQARRSGLKLLHELMLIDEKPVFNMGDDVPNRLYGQKDMKKKLRFTTGATVYNISLSCDVPFERGDATKLRLAISDATIEGKSPRLVRCLLDFAKHESSNPAAERQQEALKASTRAVSSIKKNMPGNLPWLLEALCIKCAAHLNIALKPEATEVELIELSSALDEIAAIVTEARLLSVDAVLYLYRLSDKLLLLCNRVDVSVQMKKLLEMAVVIGTHHRISSHILEHLKERL